MNFKALLRQLPTTAYLVGGAVLLLWGAWTANNYHQREIGRRDILAAQAKAGERAARRELDSLTKIQKPQTAAAVKWKTKWGTLKAGVDTQWLKPDSVPVPVEVVRTVVVTADSTIKACTLALQTCEQRVGAAQRGWDKAEDRIKLLERQMPGKLAPWRHRAEGAAVVLAVLKLSGLLR